MRTSRVMPPAVAVAHDMTNTPNRSSRCLTPATAPLRANTNVPASSSTMSVPAAYALNPASVCRTCSAPDVGIISGYTTGSSHPRESCRGTEPDGHDHDCQDNADDETVIVRADRSTVAGVTSPDTPTRRSPEPVCPWTASAR